LPLPLSIWRAVSVKVAIGKGTFLGNCGFQSFGRHRIDFGNDNGNDL
jgi:hypothetical protein